MTLLINVRYKYSMVLQKQLAIGKVDQINMSSLYHLITLLLCVSSAVALSSSIKIPPPDNDIKDFGPWSFFGPLVNFQVHQPVFTPSGSDTEYGCVTTQTLMEHEFAFSYGKPFVGRLAAPVFRSGSKLSRVGTYTPPSCSFNRVTINLTVTISGRQFDRLGIMYLGDVEVFRTSTAEPTPGGIQWEYVKEMQHLNALWQEDQKVIFDLGNLVDSKYTGVFHAKLQATFFTVLDTPAAADQILPISSQSSRADQRSAFRLPDQTARVSHTFPRNVSRAVVSLAACGQDTEEFWYQNILDSMADTFADTAGPMNGGGSWREVQLLIDGALAGVSWPFPVIFTGGVNPGLWRPVAGIDAFDLREEEIDITPWLPMLLDGLPHSFEIRVASLYDDGHGGMAVWKMTGSNWIVSGKIFLFFDGPNSISEGEPPKVITPVPQVAGSTTLTRNATGSNETLYIETTVNREILISNTITTAEGARPATWSQSLNFVNKNTFGSFGLGQATDQQTKISSASSSGFAFTADYPLSVTENVSDPSAPNLTIQATIRRGLIFRVTGPSVFPNGVQPANQSSSKPLHGSSMETYQQGRAFYFADNLHNTSTSSGTLSQKFTISGALAGSLGKVNLYSRQVRAVNGSVQDDLEQFPS